MGVQAQQGIKRMWSVGVPRTAKYSMLQKYSIALALADRPDLQGRTAHADLIWFGRLRNKVIHFEPECRSIPGAPSKMEDILPGKFAASRFFLHSPSNPYSPDGCLGYDCLRRGINACVFGYRVHECFKSPISALFRLSFSWGRDRPGLKPDRRGGC